MCSPLESPREPADDRVDPASTEVLTSMGARPYCRRSARRPAERCAAVLDCTAQQATRAGRGLAALQPARPPPGELPLPDRLLSRLGPPPRAAPTDRAFTYARADPLPILEDVLLMRGCESQAAPP